MKLIISTTTFPLNNGKLKIVLLNPKTKEPIENSLNLEKCFSLDNLSHSFKITEEIILKHPQQVYYIYNHMINSVILLLLLQFQALQLKFLFKFNIQQEYISYINVHTIRSINHLLNSYFLKK